MDEDRDIKTLLFTNRNNPDQLIHFILQYYISKYVNMTIYKSRAYWFCTSSGVVYYSLKVLRGKILKFLEAFYELKYLSTFLLPEAIICHKSLYTQGVRYITASFWFLQTTFQVF